MTTTDAARRTPQVTFVVLCLAAVAVAVSYALWARRPADPNPPAAAPGATTAAKAALAAADPAALADRASRPHLLFRVTSLDQQHGRIGIVPLDKLDEPPLLTTIKCERVHFSSGSGLCLAAERRMVTSYRAELFDGLFRPGQRLPLTGVPSRARVAPDGGLAALTYFVNADSYAAAGFSTRTMLIDWAKGAVIANLEEFTVSRDGKPFQSVDFNFWGVTFTKQPGRFYATLASGGKIYLVEGDAATRRARVLREGVECPSLSPDNRRIAFKRRMPGIRLVWRIHVLDVESGTETAVAESRSVDDQVEWLDDRTILYALPNGAVKARPSMDIWAVPIDGSGAPRVLLAEAESPAVVRPPSAAGSTR